MTVSSDVRPSPGGVWTGRSPTPGSIVKPSLGGRGPSLAVLSVSWTTTSPRTAPRIRTVRGGDGLLVGRLGQGRLRAHPRLGPATPAGPSRYAGVTMRVDVGCRHAGISIPARNAGETTLPSSAAGSASGTGHHLARRPPRRGETQDGHAANATNIVLI